jgi:hypothetical protein
VPSTDERPPDVDDVDDGMTDLVDRHVRPLIAWYQSKKRWPRRFYRATTVAVILLGASIPLLTIVESDCGSRLVIATVGVSISGLTGLATVTDWQRRWQVFTAAQTSLEARVAEWELAIAEAALAEPEQQRRMRFDATKELVTSSMAIWQSEMEAFFEYLPQTTDGVARAVGPGMV